MEHDIEIQIESEHVIINKPKSTNEYFTIRSDKAAEILGVNRTRLSQLTSKGIFPYERRKVESRSRLFYRLNDLLNYQRRSSFGNLHANIANREQNMKALAPALPQEPINIASSELYTPTKQKLNFTKPRQNTQSEPKRILKNALEAKTLYKNTERLNTLVQTVNILEAQLKKMTELLQNAHLLLQDTSIYFTDQKSRSLRIKKSMLKRPRVKRIFKFIKR